MKNKKIIGIELKSLANCELSISTYPKFKYNATGGGGKGILKETDKEGYFQIIFQQNKFNIPPINSETTKFLGVSLPPGIEIKIATQELAGYINLNTGELTLNFLAKFKFSILKLIKAPDLIVETCLNNKGIENNNIKVIGSPINKDGRTRLVGNANVDRTGNIFLDKFLLLPNIALAILECKIIYIE